MSNCIDQSHDGDSKRNGNGHDPGNIFKLTRTDKLPAGTNDRKGPKVDKDGRGEKLDQCVTGEALAIGRVVRSLVLEESNNRRHGDRRMDEGTNEKSWKE